MIQRMHRSALCCTILCIALFIAGGILAGSLSDVGEVSAAEPAASLVVVPSAAQISPGETTTVDVLVNGIVDAYAYQVTVEYDPAALRVKDADGNSANGVQVRLGSFVHPDFVVLQQVDETNGRIRVAVTQLNPTQPASGAGQLFSFDVVARASGTTTLHVAPYPTTMITNRDGESLGLTLSDAQIEVILGVPGQYGIYMPMLRGKAGAH